MLIIEGPDQAGKTSLCHALLKTLHANARKYGPIPAVYEHFSALPPSWSYPKSYLPFIKRYSIMDRFHVSELCYGRVCRGQSFLQNESVRILDCMLGLVGSVTVIITMNPDLLKAQWSKNSRDEMFTLDQVLQVNDAYMQLSDYNPELRRDLCFHLETESDYLSTDEKSIHTILSEWACRLRHVQGIFGGDFYESASREVNEVRTVC